MIGGKRKFTELLTPAASDRGTRRRLTKAKDAAKIIINRQGRSTYPDEKSVSRSEATPDRGSRAEQLRVSRRNPEGCDRQDCNCTAYGLNSVFHATQMPVTATFWKRWGDATVEFG